MIPDAVSVGPERLPHDRAWLADTVRPDDRHAWRLIFMFGTPILFCRLASRVPSFFSAKESTVPVARVVVR